MHLIVPVGVDRFYLAQRSEPKSAEAYAAACEFDVAAMRPYLIPGDVLDIGCGLGGPTALIAKHCGGALHLLDGNSWGSRHVNYGPTMDPYNDRTATDLMMAANGVTTYQWWPVGSVELPPVLNVVSLISWGWHYPVSAYGAAVAKALRPGGRLILDLRPGKGGEGELARDFEYVASYRGFGKCNKTVWQRRG